MEDLKSWLVKILIPSLVAISIKLAVMSKAKPLSWSTAIISFVTGIGCAYLCADWVFSSFSEKYAQMVIASIAISGDKIGHYFVNRLKVENIIEAAVEKMKQK